MDEIGYTFPDYPVPEDETMDSFLKKIVWFGADLKQQRAARYSERMEAGTGVQTKADSQIMVAAG